MFLYMALPSGCRRAAPVPGDSTAMRRIRAARSACCDTIPTPAQTPRERPRKAVQGVTGAHLRSTVPEENVRVSSGLSLTMFRSCENAATPEPRKIGT